jgi:hypothetical protein
MNRNIPKQLALQDIYNNKPLKAAYKPGFISLVFGIENYFRKIINFFIFYFI